MQWPDAVNGTFELGGGFMLLKNIIRLRKDRMVRGVDWTVQMWFLVYGLWNMFYYPHLKQWCSFAGGVLVVVMNGIWLAYARFYWLEYVRRMNFIFSKCMANEVTMVRNKRRSRLDS